MDKPFVLHMLTSEKNVSPFDVNMAIDAGWTCTIPYTQLEVNEVQALVQDTIFSRGPTGVKRTGIFIGGRNMFTALEMLDIARESMVPPFEVSVFADPSGAFTTAAGMVACIEKQLADSGGLKDKQVIILGGTGPVGMIVGILSTQAGADVSLLSRSLERAQTAIKRCAVLVNDAKNIKAGDNDTKAQLIPTTQVIFSVAAAGIQVISEDELQLAKHLEIAADVNVVPPSGIFGIAAQHNGTAIEGSTSAAIGIGALAIGNVKYQSQHQLLKQMCETDKPVYLHYAAAYAAARAYADRS